MKSIKISGEKYYLKKLVKYKILKNIHFNYFNTKYFYKNKYFVIQYISYLYNIQKLNQLNLMGKILKKKK